MYHVHPSNRDKFWRKCKREALGKKIYIPILSLIVRHLFVLISMAVVRLGDPEA